MTEYITVILLIFGSLFVLLAAVGVLRMPDIYARMHATTKAATLGASLMLIAVAIYFHSFDSVARVIAIIFFLFLTAPITAHLIGRTAYFTGAKFWKGTIMDELKSEYESKHRENSHQETTSPHPHDETPPSI